MDLYFGELCESGHLFAADQDNLAGWWLPDLYTTITVKTVWLSTST